MPAAVSPITSGLTPLDDVKSEGVLSRTTTFVGFWLGFAGTTIDRRAISGILEEHAMRNDLIIGVAAIVIGLALLLAGVHASNSISSGFSKAFQGAPSEKAIWLMVVGGIITIFGVVKTLRSRSKRA